MQDPLERLLDDIQKPDRQLFKEVYATPVSLTALNTSDITTLEHMTMTKIDRDRLERSFN